MQNILLAVFLLGIGHCSIICWLLLSSNTLHLDTMISALLIGGRKLAKKIGRPQREGFNSAVILDPVESQE